MKITIFLSLFFLGSFGHARDAFPLSKACMDAVKILAQKGPKASGDIAPFDYLARPVMEAFMKHQRLSDAVNSPEFSPRKDNSSTKEFGRLARSHYIFSQPDVADDQGWEQDFYSQADDGSWDWGMKAIYDDKDRLVEIQEINSKGSDFQGQGRPGASISFDYDSGECQPRDVAQLYMTPKAGTKPVQYDTKRTPLANSELCPSADSVNAFYKSKLDEMKKLDGFVEAARNKNFEENKVNYNILNRASARHRIRNGSFGAVNLSDQRRKEINDEIKSTYPKFYEEVEGQIPHRDTVAQGLSDDLLAKSTPQVIRKWIRGGGVEFDAMVRGNLDKAKEKKELVSGDFFTDAFKKSFIFIGGMKDLCDNFIPRELKASAPDSKPSKGEGSSEH